MKLKLKDYLINNDLKITNDDFDMEKLEKDLYNGYTKNDEVEKKIKTTTSNMVSKDDFDKLQNDYATLETNYNNQTKVLSDTNDRMTRVNFENKLTRKGFKDKDFDEVIKIRNSVYSDEKDDNKALDEIAERYKGTYFPDENSSANYSQAPNESMTNNSNQTNEVKISRNTSIKDLLIK